MGAEKDIIVAVELGSVSIRAIAGKREPDGTMQVLAIAQEEATNAIRKGIVDNIDKTTQAISRVVSQLNERLNVHTTRVYIGLSGQSLHTERNQVVFPYNEKTQITNKMVDQLMDINLGVIYPDAQILEVIPQEYRIGNRSVTDPVGMLCENIEAHYMNVIARNSLSENIEKCIHNAGLELAELLISPSCLADALLSANEKRSGCALVDIGSDTTTVSVYINNILRHLAVIPIGGSNVTMDITSKGMEIEEAEKLKLEYGIAAHEESQELSTQKIALSYDRSISEEDIQEITKARYEEIIANAWNHIKAESDKLLSGIVITGGGSKIKNLAQAFKELSHSDKQIRIPKSLPTNITLAPNVQVSETDNFYTLMALLLKGNQCCVGEEVVTPEETAEETEQTAEPEIAVEEEKNNVTSEQEEQETKKEKKSRSWREKIAKGWNTLNHLLTDAEEDEDNDK